VNEYVRSQIKQEANDIAKKETDRDRIIISKQRSVRKNTNVGALTIRMVNINFDVFFLILTYFFVSLKICVNKSKKYFKKIYI